MDDDRTRGFRIDFSDDEPEESIEAPEPEREPEQPSSLKPAIISVFAFCVLGVLLFAGYYQVSSRLNRIDTSGTHEIKDLRSQIDARLNDFGARLEAQTQQIDERLKQIEQKFQENAAALGKFDKQLSSTQETAQSVPSIINRLSAYIAEVDQLKADMENRVNNLNGQLKDISASVSRVDAVQAEIQSLRENLRKTGKEIDTLRTNRVDQERIDKSVNQAVSSLRAEMHRELESTRNRIDNQMASLQDQINAMDQIIKTLRDISRSTPPSPDRPLGPGEASPPGGGSGKILEQEIE